MRRGAESNQETTYQGIAAVSKRFLRRAELFLVRYESLRRTSKLIRALAGVAAHTQDDDDDRAPPPLDQEEEEDGHEDDGKDSLFASSDEDSANDDDDKDENDDENDSLYDA